MNGVNKRPNLLLQIEATQELSNVTGLIDNIHSKQQETEDDILNNTLLKDNEIKELDETLQNIMNRKVNEND
ncbi:MAG TPA: hypothetical protein VJ729_12455 [Nitrososphaeraceae archaeon]|nr:hypothetical protein [Nitrososphaeraceae archaeon]